MPITVECPDCNKYTENVPEEYVGRKVKCKSCGGKFVATPITPATSSTFTKTVLVPDKKYRLLSRFWMFSAFTFAVACVVLALRGPQIVKDYAPPATIDAQTGEKIPSIEQVCNVVIDHIKEHLAAPKSALFESIVCAPDNTEFVPAGSYSWKFWCDVHSQNRLGAMIKAVVSAVVTFDPKTKSTRIEFLALDHNPVIETTAHREYELKKQQHEALHKTTDPFGK